MTIHIHFTTLLYVPKTNTNTAVQRHPPRKSHTSVCRDHLYSTLLLNILIAKLFLAHPRIRLGEITCTCNLDGLTLMEISIAATIFRPQWGEIFDLREQKQEYNHLGVRKNAGCHTASIQYAQKSCIASLSVMVMVTCWGNIYSRCDNHQEVFLVRFNATNCRFRQWLVVHRFHQQRLMLHSSSSNSFSKFRYVKQWTDITSYSNIFTLRIQKPLL